MFLGLLLYLILHKKGKQQQSELKELYSTLKIVFYMFKAIEKDPKVTNVKLSKKLQISEYQISKAIKKLKQKGLINEDISEKSRKLFLSITNDKIFEEKNFKAILDGKKGAKPINKQFVRSTFSKIQKEKRKMLKEEYKQLKKDKVKGLASQEDFIKQNLKNDNEFADIKELFNSA